MTAEIGSPRGSRYEHVVFHDRCRRKVRRCVDFLRDDAAGPSSHRAAVTDAEPLNAAELGFLRSVFESAGLNIECYRADTLRRRLAACLRVLRAPNVTEAGRLLLKQPAKLTMAIDALVIGVTSFFRDSIVFDQLAHAVLPALPQRRRIWSVGASEGHEIYSVAMLLAEQNTLARAELLATDCRSEAVARVRQGLYDSADLRAVPPAWRDRYFAPERGNWRIARALRIAVESRVADITAAREPGAWDLILCRNMAIYFRSSVASQLWANLAMALRPGGFLVLGKAERPVGCSKLTAVAPCIYRRTS